VGSDTSTRNILSCPTRASRTRCRLRAVSPVRQHDGEELNRELRGSTHRNNGTLRARRKDEQDANWAKCRLRELLGACREDRGCAACRQPADRRAPWEDCTARTSLGVSCAQRDSARKEQTWLRAQETVGARRGPKRHGQGEFGHHGAWDVEQGARNAGTRERVAGKEGDEGREREKPARREMRARRATEAEKQGLGASSEGEREQKGLQAGGRAMEASSGRARHGR
jgi:hypothetical protein